MRGFSSGKGLSSFLQAACRLVVVVLAFAAMIGFGGAMSMLSPAIAHATGGASVFVIGASTGTSPVVVTASAGTLYDIEVTSGTSGATVKCFNLASITGVTKDAEANLIGAVVISSIGAVAMPLANFQDAARPRPGGKNASTGIACVKSAAGDLVMINWTP